MKTLIVGLMLVTMFCFPACELGVDGKKHVSFTKIGQALSSLAENVGTIAENAATGAITGILTSGTTSLATQGVSGKFDAAELQAAIMTGALNGGLNGAAAGIRQLEGRNKAPTPAEVEKVIVQNTGSQALSAVIAPGVAGAVTTAIAQGAHPDAVLETAAKSLDKASPVQLK